MLPVNPSQLKQQEAVRRWRAAEERLYPVVLASPMGYDRYMALVRGVCDELGSVRSIDVLVETYEQGVDIAAGAARSRNLPTAGLDIELVVGAAFCLRYREVLAETRQQQMRERVDEARARGEGWFVLDGVRPWLETLFPPWRSVQMHLPEGTGLHTWVEESLEPAGDGFEYGVELIRLDPDTGSWLSGEPLEARRTFNEYGLWQEAIEALRARYDEAKPVDSATDSGA